MVLRHQARSPFSAGRAGARTICIAGAGALPPYGFTTPADLRALLETILDPAIVGRKDWRAWLPRNPYDFDAAATTQALRLDAWLDAHVHRRPAGSEGDDRPPVGEQQPAQGPGEGSEPPAELDERPDGSAKIEINASYLP